MDNGHVTSDESRGSDNIDLKQIEIDVLSGLDDAGLDEEDALNVLKDVEIRLKLTIDSKCYLYSRSEEKWCEGQIAEIRYDEDTKQEWLVVNYGQKCLRKQKDVQRFCAGLKPAEFGDDYEYDQDSVMFVLECLEEVKAKKDHLNEGNTGCGCTLC